MGQPSQASIPKRISAAEAHSLVAAAPFWTKAVNELESWSYQELHERTKEAVREVGSMPPELARRLDDLITLKFVQLMTSQNALEADFRTLDLFMGAISGDSVGAGLDTLPQHYRSRWQALSDAMQVAQKLRDFNGLRAEQKQPQNAWECLAGVVVRAGKDGVAWAELADALAAVSNAPRSKGGISQLLTAMQSKGWLESLTRGRNKYFFAGPRIAESAAWQSAHGRSPPNLSHQKLEQLQRYESVLDWLESLGEDGRRRFEETFLNTLGGVQIHLGKSNKFEVHERTGTYKFPQHSYGSVHTTMGPLQPPTVKDIQRVKTPMAKKPVPR